MKQQPKNIKLDREVLDRLTAMAERSEVRTSAKHVIECLATKASNDQELFDFALGLNDRPKLVRDKTREIKAKLKESLL